MKTTSRRSGSLLPLEDVVQVNGIRLLIDRLLARCLVRLRDRRHVGTLLGRRLVGASRQPRMSVMPQTRVSQPTTPVEKQSISPTA